MPLHIESALEDALTHSADGAMVIGNDERVVLWNPSAERLLGHAPEDVIGRACYDVLAGRDEAGNRLCSRECPVLRLARRGDPVRTFDMRTLTKANRQVWLNISTLVCHTPDGGCVIIHLFRDVTGKAASPRLPDERPSAMSPAAAGAASLTRREREVLGLMAAGIGTREAGGHLGVTRATVRNHVQSILGKLGAHSRLQAVAIARRQRLL
jgi:PAS domain S-box-containing protein